MQFTLGSKFRSYGWSKTSSSRFRVIIAAAATILLLPVGFAPAQAEDGEAAVSPEGRSSAVNETSGLLEPGFQDLSDPNSNEPDGGISTPTEETNLEDELDTHQEEGGSDDESEGDVGVGAENESTDPGVESSELNYEDDGAEDPAETGDPLEEPKLGSRDIKPTAVGKTTITITKVGDRNGSGITSGAPVSGVVFDAYAATSTSTTPPVNASSIGTCTTVANGKCDIVVDNNYPYGVWIKETSVPAGWLPITAIGTGAYNLGKTATPYQFRVQIGTGSANTTRNVPADATVPNQLTSGVWVNSRVNPGFPEVCGLSIAMIFDTSASINGAEMAQFKTAARNFLGDTALGGTPSQVAMFSFDTVARQMNSGTSYNLAIPGSAGSNSGYLGAQAMVNSLPSQGNSNGYTNWDAALRLVNQSGNFDMVLMLTDGDPTTHGSGTERSTNVQFRMVEQAAMSANILKTSVGPSGYNTKIVGVGVGLTSNSFLSLQTITGPSQGQDYFLSNNFDDLESTLQEIATKNCASTLTVIKQIQDPDGNITSMSASGWEFTATGPVIENGSETRTTTVEGTNFRLVFPDPVIENVQVIETPQQGMVFHSATCTGAAGAITVQPNGFTVPVSGELITSCTVVNKMQPVSVKASKTWVITDHEGAVLRTAHIPANTGDDELPVGLSAILKLSSPSSTSPTEKVWGETITGYSQGETVYVSEQTQIDQVLLPRCEMVSSLVTSKNGDQLPEPAELPYSTELSYGETSFNITNTVQCSTQLTLLKEIEDGAAAPSDWNLIATPQNGGTDKTVVGDSTRNEQNTFEVVADMGYLLTEQLSAGNTTLAYQLDRVEHCTPTGESCTWNVIDPATPITVSLGGAEIYRFVNVPMPLLTIPLTGGLGADWIIASGALVAFAATTGALIFWRRSRRLTTG